MKKQLCFVIATVLLAGAVSAEILVQYDFEEGTRNPGTVAAHISALPLSPWGPAANIDSPRGQDGRAAWHIQKKADPVVTQIVTVVVAEGYFMNVTDAIIDHARSRMATVAWAYSSDGISYTPLGSPVDIPWTDSWTNDVGQSGLSLTDLSGTHYFKISLAGDNWKDVIYDNVTLRGSTSLATTNPVLSYFSVSINDEDGDGRAEPGEDLDVTLTLNNSGTEAHGVQASVSIASPYFSISGSPAGFGTIPTGSSETNGVPAVITVKPNTQPGLYTFTVGAPTATGGFYESTGGAFTVEVHQAFSVAPTGIELIADLNQSSTNAEIVITNSAGYDLICNFTANDPWITVPATLTVAPHSAANLQIIAGPLGVQTQLFGTISASYSQPFSDGSDTLNVQFDVGPKVSFTAFSVKEISGGSIPGKYEPGELLYITISCVNDGAITVNNIINTLSANPDYFAVSNLTSATYSELEVGQTTATVYRVELASVVPHGGHTFSVTNRLENLILQSASF